MGVVCPFMAKAPGVWQRLRLSGTSLKSREAPQGLGKSDFIAATKVEWGPESMIFSQFPKKKNAKETKTPRK